MASTDRLPAGRERVAHRSIREFHRTENKERQRGSAEAQKALLYGDDILAIATIGFGEFERRPEMGFDVAVAGLVAPARRRRW
jgi:hypothetical protein